MKEPRVSLAPKNPLDVPDGAILVMVEPGPSRLEEALVEVQEARTKLSKLNRPKRYKLIEAPGERENLRTFLKAAGARIMRMLDKRKRRMDEEG